MTLVYIVPAWGESPYAVPPQQNTPSKKGSFRGLETTYSPEDGCHVVVFTHRIEALPPQLENAPLRYVRLVQPNSPLTRATDGRYLEDQVVARVETRLHNGVPHQSIRVTAPDLDTANQWFDDLLMGRKLGANRNPITFPQANETLAAA